MKSYTVCVCYCVYVCLKLTKVRSKSSNRGVGFVSDGGRKAGDFHRLEDGGRTGKEIGEKNEMSMKQRGMKGGGGKRKGKSEVKKRRRKRRRRW